MFAKLDEVQGRYRELNSMLADPSVASDPQQYQKLAKEHAHLQEIVDAYKRFRAVEEELEDNKSLLSEDDPELKEMARAEIARLDAEREELEERITRLLIPKDPLDEKNILIEVRAGTGGDEAALFAADLFRMYDRYAANQGWKVDIVEASETDTGGFRQIVALIEGDDVYSKLKYEGGTHRVQRVPETETQGRIHTSACTVAILPEAEDVELDLDMNDLKIDTYRSSGPGGQSVNTTDSAIRITHEPTGLVVTCQDEKSQHKNKAKALKVLKTRLLEQKREAQHQERAAERREQVGSGDRSERIRTYNFPQSRITDHRIGYTTRRLEDVLNGDVDEVLVPVHEHFQAEKLKALNDE
ncbi:peptide chain release factor 1 [Persicimonas caeni]|uniref:Peptide chain release factor 1 n=1 Tax=Persicimonas caeni TaxID=2292766 RepID=A0A4Y6PV94_PERCE|nr:peptide chain release factor 1 [Persicimonas caeni]QDG51665.1 peptide chain release factor 1 [Persicimonas caeni]QED32886.1 peptide chain release factor 1 [Persicimonas caeni]